MGEQTAGRLLIRECGRQDFLPHTSCGWPTLCYALRLALYFLELRRWLCVFSTLTTACTFACHRNSSGITTEAGNVVFHPSQSNTLVIQTTVGFIPSFAEFLRGHEARCSKSVTEQGARLVNYWTSFNAVPHPDSLDVDSNYWHPYSFRQPYYAVHVILRPPVGAHSEAAAVNIYKHRERT